MDLQQLMSYGFTGLATIGFVNIITIFYPYIDSKRKIIFTAAFAFAMTFVPKEIGNVIYDHAIQAIGVTAASSGAYKILMSKNSN